MNIDLEDITVDDLPNEDLRLVAEICGVDVAITLLNNIAGINIYVPKNSGRMLMRKYLERKFNGRNARRLALELGISVSMVYKLLQEKQHNKQRSQKF